MLKLEVGDVYHPALHNSEGNVESGFVPLQSPEEYVPGNVFRDVDITDWVRQRRLNHGNDNRPITLWHSRH